MMQITGTQKVLDSRNRVSEYSFVEVKKKITVPALLNATLRDICRHVPHNVAAQVFFEFLPELIIKNLSFVQRDNMKMEVFAECDEQKDRVKACYGDWFHKLWSGSFDQADCEQETQDFRQCVHDVMKRRKEQAKNKWHDDDNCWMDRTKEHADDFASDVKSHARHTRDRAHHEKEDVKSTMKGKASEARDKMQRKASEARDRVHDKASDVSDKAQDKASDAKKNANGTISNVASKVQDTADSWAEKIKGLGK